MSGAHEITTTMADKQAANLPYHPMGSASSTGQWGVGGHHAGFIDRAIGLSRAALPTSTLLPKRCSAR